MFLRYPKTLAATLKREYMVAPLTRAQKPDASYIPIRLVLQQLFEDFAFDGKWVLAIG